MITILSGGGGALVSGALVLRVIRPRQGNIRTIKARAAHAMRSIAPPTSPCHAPGPRAHVAGGSRQLPDLRRVCGRHAVAAVRHRRRLLLRRRGYSGSRRHHRRPRRAGARAMVARRAPAVSSARRPGAIFRRCSSSGYRRRSRASSRWPSSSPSARPSPCTQTCSTTHAQLISSSRRGPSSSRLRSSRRAPRSCC